MWPPRSLLADAGSTEQLALELLAAAHLPLSLNACIQFTVCPLTALTASRARSNQGTIWEFGVQSANLGYNSGYNL